MLSNSAYCNALVTSLTMVNSSKTKPCQFNHIALYASLQMCVKYQAHPGLGWK